VDLEDGSQAALDTTGPAPIEVAPSVSPKSTDPSPVAARTHRRPSRKILQIALIAGVGVFLLFLCGSVGLFGTWASLGLPGISRNPSQTAAPTQAPTQETILFADDFSDPGSGWPTIRNARGGYDYRADGYHIFVDEIDAVLWAKTNREDGDASISVDTKPVIEGMNSYYGLICRVRDDQNFYYFAVGANGDYTIGKYKDGVFQSLFPDGWRHSDAVNLGNQTNRLKAECAGNTLRFYANNELLDVANDTDFSSGFSGILVGGLDPQGFEVVFNNFLITKPAQ
jgi:hypothetical protein